MTRIALALSVSVLSAVTAPAVAHIGSHSVTVQDNEFVPARLEVDTGETVTWIAKHGGHTITADDGSFRHEPRQGTEVSRTFSDNAVVYYHCSVHGSPGNGSRVGTGMAGVIVVGPAIAADHVTEAERDGPWTVRVPLTLSRPATEMVSVEFATEDGTARAGEDYEAASGSVTFSPGVVSATVEVPILGDTDREPGESFVVRLDGAVGGALERSSVQVTLQNDDDVMRVVPSEAYPTLASAMEAIKPQTVVNVVAPLAYSTPVTVAVDRITIAGADASATLHGGNVAAPALRVRARGVRIQDIAIEAFATGIEVTGASSWTVQNVTLSRGEYGIRATGSTGGWIEQVTVSRALRAGISIADCAQCDVVVTSADARESFIGIETVNASGVVIRRSTLRDNWNGIALRAGAASLRGGAHVVDNVITRSGFPGAARVAAHAARAQRGDLVQGAGIWVSGDRLDTIERNEVTGGRYGIVIAGFGAPAEGITVRSNTVSGSDVPLGWDGIGASVCFSGNNAPQDNTSPPAIEALYACERPTAGVPNPALLADLFVNGSK